MFIELIHGNSLKIIFLIMLFLKQGKDIYMLSVYIIR